MTEDTTNVILPSSEEYLPSQQIAPTLDNFKAAYYWLNAKPDTDILLLKGEKLITIGDIRFVNEQILKKLENYKDYGSSSSISVVLGKNRIKEYGSWYEFDRENWKTLNELTKSLSISWDFAIKLPRHEVPQRHTVKIRIGSYIPPKDMFQLMMSSDDITEIMESRAEGICKVDFINQTIANELLSIVSTWYDGLKKVPVKIGPIQRLLEKHQKTIIRTVANITPILILAVYHYYFLLFTRFNHFHYGSLDNIQWVLLGILFVYTIGQIISRRMARWLDEKIDSYKPYSRFLITKGDENSHDELSKTNESISKEIRTRVFWGIVTAFISIGIRYLIDKK